MKEVEISNLSIDTKVLSNIAFDYTWTIENYIKFFDENAKDLDSPHFEVNVNGIKSKWSLALRFWTDENGTRLTNPVVFCLNLISISAPQSYKYLKVCFKFIVWGDGKGYETCANEMKSIDLSRRGIRCVGVKEVLILDQNLINNHRDVQVACRISFINECEESSGFEIGTLESDLIKSYKSGEGKDLILKSQEGTDFKIHSQIVSMRSKYLKGLIERAQNGFVDVDVNAGTLEGLLEFIYTDKIPELISESPQNLLKIGHQFQLERLKAKGEEELIGTINLTNVANLLMLADTFEAENLKKAALEYCEENFKSIIKNVAWKVMEQVNPMLFEQVCQQL